MDYNSSFENKVINLDHHVYDNLNDTWTKKSSQPQPYVNVSVETKVEDYKSLGYVSNFPSKPRKSTVSAMADTGCQSCQAGIRIAHLLGLNERNLIPVTLKMHAANNRNIKILGATILHFSGTNSAGEMFETRQVVYITNSSDKPPLASLRTISPQLVTLKVMKGCPQIQLIQVRYMTLVVIVPNVNFRRQCQHNCHSQPRKNIEWTFNSTY